MTQLYPSLPPTFKAQAPIHFGSASSANIRFGHSHESGDTCDIENETDTAEDGENGEAKKGYFKRLTGFLFSKSEWTGFYNPFVAAAVGLAIGAFASVPTAGLSFAAIPLALLIWPMMGGKKADGAEEGEEAEASDQAEVEAADDSSEVAEDEADAHATTTIAQVDDEAAFARKITNHVNNGKLTEALEASDTDKLGGDEMLLHAYQILKAVEDSDQVSTGEESAVDFLKNTAKAGELNALIDQLNGGEADADTDAEQD